MTDAKNRTPSQRFPPGSAEAVRPVCPRLAAAPRLPQGRERFRHADGRHGGRTARRAQSRFAEAQKIAPADLAHKNRRSFEIDSASGNGKVRGLPRSSGPMLRPAAVIPGSPRKSRPLNPHIEDIARRSLSIISSPSRPTRCFRSAAIPATRTARVSFSQAGPDQDSRRFRRGGQLSPRAAGGNGKLRAVASAMAAASSTGSPNRPLRVRAASRLICGRRAPSMARRRTLDKVPTSRANCC